MHAMGEGFAVALAGALAIVGCSPSEADYGQAVSVVWPQFQAEERDRAEFFSDHASSFDRSSLRSAEISRSLGGDDTVSVAHRQSAAEARGKAREARYLSQSSVLGVRDVRCASAEPLPGKNCEMILSLKGPDAKKYDTPASWRFDRVGGRLAVVGSVQR